MAEPERENGDVNSGAPQLHGQGVAERVGGDGLGRQGRAFLAGDLVVPGQPGGDGVACQPSSAPAGEQRVAVVAAGGGEPVPQHGDRLLVQRGAAFLAPFPQAADVRARAEVDITAVELGQFRYPQPGAQQDEEHCVVAAAGPAAAAAGGGEQGGAFGCVEPGDEGCAGAAAVNGQNLLDDLGVLGCVQGRVPVERADRGQARVAGPGAVAPLILKLLQEARDQLGVELPQLQFPRRGAGRLLGVAEQQAEGVPY